jgi:hypothetical protein
MRRQAWQLRSGIRGACPYLPADQGQRRADSFRLRSTGWGRSRSILAAVRRCRKITEGSESVWDSRTQLGLESVTVWWLQLTARGWHYGSSRARSSVCDVLRR